MKTDDPVTFHFSKKEMSDLNKTGKVVQTDDKGVERVFIYDDKFNKTSKTETDSKKDQGKAGSRKGRCRATAAEAKRLAETVKAAEAKRLAEKKAAEARRLAEKKAAKKRD